ncbi:unnamed protein product [Brachionus calyciflorus]|uniref:Uncharacterized protein n=1 Tax=Brachionus calyciflorus TaxID=104777 RepID=A0A814FKP2_9BILA|nr:unnamed protein product [Brachionus calyciflorus]
MSEDSNLAIFYSIGILSVALGITIYGLDIAVMTKTTYSGSIAMNSFDAQISYSNIYISTIVLGFIYILGQAVSIYLATENKGLNFLYLSFAIIILNCYYYYYTSREAISYKFFICFNYTYYRFVQARALLTLISVILLIGVHIMWMIDEKNRSERVLNVFTLIKLNTNFNKDINPKAIKIGYFTEKEIDQIKENNFIKYSNYTNRIISNLNDIIFSDNKRVAYRTCTRSSCTYYYLRTLNAEITCNSDSEKFYSDCSTAHKLKIQIKYLDGGHYPIYNCALIEKDATCRQACPGLIDHKLFLVQELNDRVDPRWDGFCNCEFKSPRIKLTEDIGLNLCDNKGSLLKINYLIFSLFNFLAYFNFYKIF